MEKIESLEGELVLIPEIEKKLLGIIYRSPDLSLIQKQLWKRKIIDDSQNYLHLIEKFSSDLNRTAEELIEEIKDYVEKFTNAINLLDRGASPDDCAILANAIWISEKPGLSVSLATDDRDLLGAGHALASYLGKDVRILSIFEVLKKSEMSDLLHKYCNYCGLRSDIEYKAGKSMSAEELQGYTSELARKAKLTFHPTLSRTKSIKSILRQI